jgi:hypothetical protein
MMSDLNKNRLLRDEYFFEDDNTFKILVAVRYCVKSGLYYYNKKDHSLKLKWYNRICFCGNSIFPKKIEFHPDMGFFRCCWKNFEGCMWDENNEIFNSVLQLKYKENKKIIDKFLGL